MEVNKHGVYFPAQIPRVFSDFSSRLQEQQSQAIH